jgi:nucleoid-associated protein YgaU
MAPIRMKRIALPFIAIAVGSIALAAGIQLGRWEVAVEPKMPFAERAIANPASGVKEQGSGALAAALAKADALATALSGSTVAPANSDGMATFDVTRIEPSGEAVIAGRAAPGATVELLRNGEVHDRAVADQFGQFVIVPPRLPAGSYELTLRSKLSNGTQATSKQSIAVEIAPRSTVRPLVALITPGKPTILLSQPTEPEPKVGAVVVESVETEGGKLYVSGQARPGATVKLYLNESFVASVTAGTDGRFAVSIIKGAQPGDYRVRLDEMDSNLSTVRTRAEVPFKVPDSTIASSSPAPTSLKPPDLVATEWQSNVAKEVVLAVAGPPSIVVVPEIQTATVTRGDSLWRLSRLSYGAGTRYTVIYKANREQVRNPNMIYPGQILVVPTQTPTP